jgi:hypothetical protein
MSRAWPWGWHEQQTGSGNEVVEVRDVMSAPSPFASKRRATQNTSVRLNVDSSTQRGSIAPSKETDRSGAITLRNGPCNRASATVVRLQWVCQVSGCEVSAGNGFSASSTLTLLNLFMCGAHRHGLGRAGCLGFWKLRMQRRRHEAGRSNQIPGKPGAAGESRPIISATIFFDGSGRLVPAQWLPLRGLEARAGTGAHGPPGAL